MLVLDTETSDRSIWTDQLKAAQAARTAAHKRPPANTLAVPIFAAIDRLAKPETDKEGQLLAIKLTWVALSMPHSDQDLLIARVLALPRHCRRNGSCLPRSLWMGKSLTLMWSCRV